MKNYVFLMFIFLLASGCATEARHKEIMDKSIGWHIDDIVAVLGPPQSTFDLMSGGKVFEYIDEDNYQWGGYTYTAPQVTYNSGSISSYGVNGSTSGRYSGTSTTYVQKQSPIRNMQLICKIRFITNKEGIIINWNSDGNHCKAR